MRMRACGERKSTRDNWERNSGGNKRRRCAACCRIFCGKPSRFADRPFLIFLTPEATRENISGTTERTDARGRAAIAVKRASGARLWQGAAAIFARNASVRRAALPFCRCRGAEKQEKA